MPKSSFLSNLDIFFRVNICIFYCKQRILASIRALFCKCRVMPKRLFMPRNTSSTYTVYCYDPKNRVENNVQTGQHKFVPKHIILGSIREARVGLSVGVYLGMIVQRFRVPVWHSWIPSPRLTLSRNREIRCTRVGSLVKCIPKRSQKVQVFELSICMPFSDLDSSHKLFTSYFFTFV